MPATTNSAPHPSRDGPLGQFTMLLSISVPIMALYVAGAIDYANMLFKDQPTQIAADLAAPAKMAEAVRSGAPLPDTPALAFAASYAKPSAPARSPSGEMALALAATSAERGFGALAPY